MTSRFEVFEGSDGFYWRLRSANGEIVASSEAYTRRADAFRGAADAAEAARTAEVVDAE